MGGVIAALASLLVWGQAFAGERHTIAFGSFAPINAEIFVAQPDGDNARALAPNPANDVNPTLSGDGRWVYFTSYRRGSADLYRIRPDGAPATSHRPSCL